MSLTAPQSLEKYLKRVITSTLQTRCAYFCYLHVLNNIKLNSPEHQQQRLINFSTCIKLVCIFFLKWYFWWSIWLLVIMGIIFYYFRFLILSPRIMWSNLNICSAHIHKVLMYIIKYTHTQKGVGIDTRSYPPNLSIILRKEKNSYQHYF